MGTWGADLLASDDALDALGTIEDVALLNVKLYPLKLKDGDAESARPLLEASVDDIMAHQLVAENLAVAAAVFMHIGAAMPERMVAGVIGQIDKEIDDLGSGKNSAGWRDGGKKRLAVMKDFREKVTGYRSGNRVSIEHRGLFESMRLPG